MRRVAIIVLGVLGVAWPGASRDAAAETVGLVTLTPAETPVSTPALERAVRLALSGAGHRVVLDPIAAARGRAMAGAVLADRLRPFARAEDLLAEGWRSYAQVQMEVAKARLVAARQAALEVADLAGGVALVAETSLRLGVIEFELGDAEAAADFRLAHRLAPDRAVTDDEFKPAVVTAFRAAIAAPTVKRPVSVSVVPTTAALEIDGTERGAGAAIELEVGLHLLVVSAPGMIAAGNLAVVGSTGSAELNATLAPEPSSAGLFAGNLELGSSPVLAAHILDSTLLFAELDAIVIASAAWAGDQMRVYAQRCAGTPVRCSPVEVMTVGEEAALAVSSSLLVSRIEKSPPREEAARLPSHPPILSSKKPVVITTVVVPDPWWKNRWLWVGVGAAALAAGTTAVILSIDGDSPLIISADPCDFGGC